MLPLSATGRACAVPIVMILAWLERLEEDADFVFPLVFVTSVHGMEISVSFSLISSIFMSV